MVESGAQRMETVVEAEKTLAAGVESEARVSSGTGESFGDVDCPDGVILSRSEKRKRTGGVRRVVVCYLRKMSPVRMLRKMRDCYVATLGGCAQRYVSTYPSFGGDIISCQGSSLPVSLRGSMRGNGDVYGAEFCLSPAFKKSFNEALRGLGALGDSDQEPPLFRKSFSDFESCVSAQMRRTYSDAAVLYSGRSGNSRAGYCRRSPGWAPSRSVGPHSMMIFPIQEAPELILASFRKEAQELRLASFRTEAAEPGFSHRKDGELLAGGVIQPNTVNVSCEEGL